MDRNQVTTLTLIFLMLVIVILGISANTVLANPYLHEYKVEGTIPPPEGTKPPVVIILSPINSTSYSTNNLLLNFNATIERSNNVSLTLTELYYVASWQGTKNYLNLAALFRENNFSYPTNFTVELNNIPEGPKWIDIFAVATSIAYETRHEIKNNLYYIQYYVAYESINSARVNFNVDKTPPTIISYSIENNSQEPKLFTITNEPISELLLSIDEKEPIIYGWNQTLPVLPVGLHNASIQIKDLAGNIGISEPVTFSISTMETSLNTTTLVLVVIVILVTSALAILIQRKYKVK